MKKIILYLLLGLLVLSGCSNNQKVNTTNENKAETTTTSTFTNITTTEKLKETVKQDTEETLSNLESDFEKLKKDVNSYSKYQKNTDKINDFYDKCYDETKQIGIRLRQYSLIWVQLILKENSEYEKRYEKLDDVYDYIYEDALSEVYKIYDDVLSDMFDTYYNGIVSDGYDTTSYKKWSEVSKKAYNSYSDASKNIYREYSDISSDVYSFISDCYSRIDDEDRMNELFEDFEKDIEKLSDK